MITIHLSHSGHYSSKRRYSAFSKTRLCSRSVREKKLKTFSLAKNVKLCLVNWDILPPLSESVGTFLNDRDPRNPPDINE